MKKTFYFAFLLFGVASCTGQNNEIEQHIGLYEVVESHCELEEGVYNPCNYTQFFEIVKGQFIGTGNDEIGYVFWSGDPNIDPELQYTSHTISNYQNKKIKDGRYYLNGSQTSEYLVFSRGQITEYYSVYEEAGKSTQHKITYKLKEVKRGNLPNYRLNYPGNQ